jgi:Protein of unknown function (DUF3435)
MLDTLVFRRSIPTKDGVRTSPEKALTYDTYHDYLKRLGRSAGFMEILTTYCIRRGTGNAIDGAFLYSANIH